MMTNANPFTPAFGGKPQHFFGRHIEVSMIDEALENEFSPHRALFITGNRGYGKTALLEHASQRAAKRRWETVDVHSANASMAILKKLVGGSERAVERSLQPGALGISVGKASASVKEVYEAADLADVLLDACRKLTVKNGIFISVDEVQKIPEQDMENICAAVQMSTRKGFPVMLLLAGLPGAKETVSAYPGCTFMQRVSDVRIDELLVEETMETFRALLARVPDVNAGDDVIWELSRFSQGHPYLMQLAGYYYVELARERKVGEGGAGIDVVRAIKPEAYAAYRANVLEPILGSLGESLHGYLAAIASILDEEGRANTGEIARALGKTAQQCSSFRERLLAKRLICEDGWGFVRFGLPHMYDYYHNAPVRSPRRREGSWAVR